MSVVKPASNTMRMRPIYPMSMKMVCIAGVRSPASSGPRSMPMSRGPRRGAFVNQPEMVDVEERR